MKMKEMIFQNNITGIEEFTIRRQEDEDFDVPRVNEKIINADKVYEVRRVARNYNTCKIFVFVEVI